MLHKVLHGIVVMSS